MLTTNRKRRKSDSINIPTNNSRDEPMTMQCWARDSPDETSERHPAFISVNIYNKINRGGGVVDELVWIKWSSTGHKTEIPRSQVSLNLEPRSRRRSAAASRELDDSDDGDDDNKSKKKREPSTPKQKRRKYTKSASSTTTPSTKRVEKNEKSEATTNPLDRFLKPGVNSTRNSSSPLRQKLLETSSTTTDKKNNDQEAAAEKKKRGPIEQFLLKGVNSTKNSTRDITISSHYARSRVETASAGQTTNIISQDMIVKKDDDDANDSKQASVCNNETPEPSTTVQPTNIISQDGIVKKEEDNESVYGYETD